MTDHITAKKPPASVHDILEAYLKDITDSLTAKNGRIYVDWKTADANLRAMTAAYATAEIKRMLEQSMRPAPRRRRHRRR